MPKTKICFNIKTKKVDHTFIRLLKIDPDKPYGDFDIFLLFREINEEDYYRPIYINFGSNSDPMIFNVKKSGESEEEVDEATTDEAAEDGESENKTEETETTADN